jgi:hypothetical protein
LKIQLARIEIVVDAIVAPPIVAPATWKRAAWIELRVPGATGSVDALDAIRMEDLRVAGAHIAAATVEFRTNAIADDRPIGALARAAVVANLPRRTANIRTGAVFVAHRRRARIWRTFTVRGVAALRHTLAGAILTPATSPTARAAFHPAATKLVVPTAPFVMAISIGIAHGGRAGIWRMLAIRCIAAFRHTFVRAILETAAASR